MIFRHDWRHILTRAWSLRLILLAGLLSGLEAALAFVYDIWWLPDWAVPGLTVLVACAAFVARLMAQKNMR